MPLVENIPVFRVKNVLDRLKRNTDRPVRFYVFESYYCYVGSFRTLLVRSLEKVTDESTTIEVSLLLPSPQESAVAVPTCPWRGRYSEHGRGQVLSTTAFTMHEQTKSRQTSQTAINGLMRSNLLKQVRVDLGYSAWDEPMPIT